MTKSKSYIPASKPYYNTQLGNYYIMPMGKKYRVVFNGYLTRPSFNTAGQAHGYLSQLQKREKEPEYEPSPM